MKKMKLLCSIVLFTGVLGCQSNATKEPEKEPEWRKVTIELHMSNQRIGKDRGDLPEGEYKIICEEGQGEMYIRRKNGEKEIIPFYTSYEEVEKTIHLYEGDRIIFDEGMIVEINSVEEVEVLW